MNDYYHKIQLHRLITRSSCNICVLFNVTKTRTFTSGTVTVTHCTNTVVSVLFVFHLQTDYRHRVCVVCFIRAAVLPHLSCHICPGGEDTLQSPHLYILLSACWFMCNAVVLPSDSKSK